MAQLHYQNIENHRPDVLMTKAFYGLSDFYKFLNNARRYMESDAAIKRLAWQPSDGPENEHGAESDEHNDYWIQLTEPKDRPNEPDSTFRMFLDENVSELYDEITHQNAKQTNGRIQHRFKHKQKLKILDRDPKTQQICLEKYPEGEHVLIRPNTYQINRQIQALQKLQNQPQRAHRPLLRLFESTSYARWPSVTAHFVSEWMVLTNNERPGTSKQRQFVEQALGSPDFAFLEGPPGSGKTTCICELILQLAKKGQRVLLCASTHVAVDNVLERIMDEHNEYRNLIIPVRIGDKRNVSIKAQKWQFGSFLKTERKRLLDGLRHHSHPSPAQKMFQQNLRADSTIVERLVLDGANLICGTTIGILQHPDIKSNRHAFDVPFDVLIIDEASKTPFQEFLVPAILAKKWIVIGDPKQLSPYVDDSALAVNIQTCLPDIYTRQAAVDVFIAGHKNIKKRKTAIVNVSHQAQQTYQAQADAHDILLCTLQQSDIDDLPLASIVAANLPLLEQHEHAFPLDTATIRAPENTLIQTRRQRDAWISTHKRPEPPAWSEEISWRIARLYEQRTQHDNPSKTIQTLSAEIEQLLPVQNAEEVRKKIHLVKRVALPSILESLRNGFERSANQREGTAMSDGLPEYVMKHRHTLLSHQHRMHKDIAHFSHTHVYNGEALLTPKYLDEKRTWTYQVYAQAAVWIESRGGFDRRFNKNPKEARLIIKELKKFDHWAKQNQQQNGQPWEVAILTFYRGQEKELRKHLRKWSGTPKKMRHFSSGPKNKPHLSIELCTVDRFQGHEADIVFISFAKDHATNFLESPNRLNVALTRARYQRVIVGDRKKLGRSKSSLLGTLANEECWEQSIIMGDDNA